MFFRDGRHDASNASMFEKLRGFKYIYVLYFLADILCSTIMNVLQWNRDYFPSSHFLEKF